MHIQLKLSSDPSKQEEIDCFTKFVENLPVNSYLSDILKNTQYEVENLIKSDFALPLVPSTNIASFEHTIDRTTEENFDLRHKVTQLQFFIPHKYKIALNRFRRSYKRCLDYCNMYKKDAEHWCNELQHSIKKNNELIKLLEVTDTNLFN